MRDDRPSRKTNVQMYGIFRSSGTGIGASSASTLSLAANSARVISATIELLPKKNHLLHRQRLLSNCAAWLFRHKPTPPLSAFCSGSWAGSKELDGEATALRSKVRR